MPKQSKKCALCESREGELNPQVFCDYDIQERKMIVKDVKVKQSLLYLKQCICPTCKRAMDIRTIMNLLVNQSKDSEEVSLGGTLDSLG